MKHLIETDYFNLVLLTKFLYLLPDFQIYNSQKTCLYVDLRFLFLCIKIVIPFRTNFPNFNTMYLVSFFSFNRSYIRLVILNHVIFTYYKNGR